jgi:hypothetical protein
LTLYIYNTRATASALSRLLGHFASASASRARVLRVA